MKKVLIVDDEERMVDLISLYLTPYGYHCVKSYSGCEAIEWLEKESFDLVLLDIMMPNMDGWEACREIRKNHNVSIIMLTARDQKVDVVKGLKMGADDYITKPFDEDILVARIESLMRRSGYNGQKIYEFKGLIWNGHQFTVSYEDSEITLTPKEFHMLGLFLNNPQKVFSRDQLIDLIWGFESETEGRTIDSHIRNIRDKCRKSGFPIDDHLLTVWGVGYKWV
jgi:DNA-binding response OmpR family regulator